MEAAIKESKIKTIEDYEQFIGAETVDRIRKKAERMRDLHTVHVNSTFYGGGVATLLSSLTLLMNSCGVKTGWRVIQGSPDYFSITKKIHSSLQGSKINLNKRKKQIYEDVVFENSVRTHLDHHDIVVIHDPQPLPMIEHYRKRGPWIWRCHVDLTELNTRVWKYLDRFIEQYDAVILTLSDYRQKLKTPQVFFYPAIDPFTITNRELTDEEMDDRFEHYGIPGDKPIVAQISRFDPWKDPEGVIRAFKEATKQVDARLILLGNIATDDPEGQDIYESLLKYNDDNIRILSCQDSALVNTIQRRADVIIQKSLREGFGLTVTEAMWKGTPVIGADVGGIRHQISNGSNGFLVSSEQETAKRIVQLIKDRDLRSRMGEKARETVRKKFLLTRLLEQYIDLYSSFETDFKLK